MQEPSKKASSTVVKQFALGAIGIYLFFTLLFVFVAANGGVDVFIAVAPMCFISFQFLVSAYVGVFAAVYAKSYAKTSWTWGLFGFMITATFTYISQLLLPPLALLAPILSGILMMYMISFQRQ